MQFAFMGAALAQTVLGVERPRVGLLSNGEEHARGSPLVLETDARAARRRRPRRRARFEFVGNVEGGDVIERRGRCGRHRRLTGNIALKLIEGVSQTMLGAIRDAAMPRRARKARGRCCCGPRCERFATRSTPRRRAAPTCSGCAGWGSCRTGASPAGLRAGDPARGAGRRGGSRRDAPTRRSAGGGAAARPRPPSSARGR